MARFLCCCTRFPLTAACGARPPLLWPASDGSSRLTCAGSGSPNSARVASPSPNLADDLAALLDGLKLPAATVGGMSMGGYVALAFARRHRDRLKSLILADTKAAADTPEARQGREDAISLVEKHSVAALLEKQIPRLLSASASEGLRAEVRALGAQPADTVIAAIRALRDRPDRTAELPEIAVPTLVVVGNDDALSPPAEAHAMAAACPMRAWWRSRVPVTCRTWKTRTPLLPRWRDSTR